MLCTLGSSRGYKPRSHSFGAPVLITLRMIVVLSIIIAHVCLQPSYHQGVLDHHRPTFVSSTLTLNILLIKSLRLMGYSHSSLFLLSFFFFFFPPLLASGDTVSHSKIRFFFCFFSISKEKYYYFFSISAFLFSILDICFLVAFPC